MNDADDDREELRLVGVTDDGHRLVLTDRSGQEVGLAIDDRLRAAVNGHLSRLGQLTMALESGISPREIQARVRAGESPDDVAKSASVPVERVMRFVGPVLREREHAAEEARRARLSRGTDGPAPLLGDVVDHALARRGLDAETAEWDASKRDDGAWTVVVSWTGSGGKVVRASWRVDIVSRQATPLDDAARECATSTGSAGSGGAGEFGGADREPEDARVHAFVPRLAPSANVLPESGTDTGTDTESETDADPGAPLDTEAQPPAVPNDDDAAEPAEAAQPTPSPRPGRKGKQRRAEVPKWDDIIFGTKRQD